MPILAHSVASEEVNSFETGTALGRQLRARFEQPTAAVIVYATISHDHRALLAGVRAALGPEPVLIGCSAQGVMGRGCLLEEGYAAGAMALNGARVRASSALVHRIREEPRAKGRALGTALLAGLSVPPKAVVVHYDPLGGADVGLLLDGLHEVVSCPVIGGGAAQPAGPMIATFQFMGEEVHRGSAVALGLGGDFSAVAGACHGTTPVGLRMTVTRSEETTILELDGRPAIEVWSELTGEADLTLEHQANMAIGLPDECSDLNLQHVLAPFGIDRERGGIVLLTALPAGTEIMLHHRTEQSVLEGTRRMVEQIQASLGGRTLRAALGFECGARSAQFLGTELVQDEVRTLQQTLGQDAAWLGMLAWGEVFPIQRGPAVFNYTYPLLCLTD